MLWTFAWIISLELCHDSFYLWDSCTEMLIICKSWATTSNILIHTRARGCPSAWETFPPLLMIGKKDCCHTAVVVNRESLDLQQVLSDNATCAKWESLWRTAAYFLFVCPWRLCQPVKAQTCVLSSSSCKVFISSLQVSSYLCTKQYSTCPDHCLVWGGLPMSHGQIVDKLQENPPPPLFLFCHVTLVVDWALTYSALSALFVL